MNFHNVFPTLLPMLENVKSFLPVRIDWLLTWIDQLPSSVDKNECKVENGGCSHNCVNTRGSYKCECADGYKLAGDGKNCLRKFGLHSVISHIWIGCRKFFNERRLSYERPPPSEVRVTLYPCGTNLCSEFSGYAGYLRWLCFQLFWWARKVSLQKSSPPETY